MPCCSILRLHLDDVHKAFPQAHRSAASRSVLARLVFEAGTLVVAELRHSLSQEDTPQKRALEEHSSRIQAVKSRLGSWLFVGQFEPSHHLVDLASGTMREQAIRHILPSKCSSRDAVVGSLKKDEHLVRLENSTLRMSAKQHSVRVDLSTDLRLYQAVPGICSCDVHERCMRVLFDHMHRQPPVGFVGPTRFCGQTGSSGVW